MKCPREQQKPRLVTLVQGRNLSSSRHNAGCRLDHRDTPEWPVAVPAVPMTCCEFPEDTKCHKHT